MEPRKLCQLQLNQFRSQKQYDEQMLKHNELADEAIVREKKLNATENELKEATANKDNLMKEIENQFEEATEVIKQADSELNIQLDLKKIDLREKENLYQDIISKKHSELTKFKKNLNPVKDLIKRKKDEVARQVERNDTLFSDFERELKAKNTKLSQVEESIQDIIKDRAQVETHINDKIDEKENAAKSITSIKRNLETVLEEQSKAQDEELVGHQETLKSVNEKISGIEAETKNIQYAMEVAHKAAVAEEERLNENHVKILAENELITAVVEDEIKEKEEYIEEKDKIIEQIMDKITKQVEEKVQEETGIQERKEKLEGMKEEKENINQTINKLEAEIQETQRKEHILAQQRSQIKEDIKAVNNEIFAIEGHNRPLRAKLNEMEELLDVRQNDPIFDELSAKVKELSKREVEIRKIREKIKTFRKEAAAKENKLVEASKENHQLIEAKEQKDKKLEALREKRKNLLLEKKKKEDELEESRLHLETTVLKTVEIRTEELKIKEEISILEAKLSDFIGRGITDQKLTEKRVRFADEAQKLQEAKDEVENLKLDKENKAQELEDLLAEEENLKQKKAEMAEKISNIKQNNEKKENRRASVLKIKGEQESKQEIYKKLQAKKALLEEKIQRQREEREKSLDELSVGLNQRKHELEKRDSELSQKLKEELPPPEDDVSATPEQLLAYMEADAAEAELHLKSLREETKLARDYIKEHDTEANANVDELNETLVRRTKAKKNYDERKKKQKIEKHEIKEEKRKPIIANPDSDCSWNAPPEPEKKKKPSKIPRLVESPPKAQIVTDLKKPALSVASTMMSIPESFKKPRTFHEKIDVMQDETFGSESGGSKYMTPRSSTKSATRRRPQIIKGAAKRKEETFSDDIFDF
ncbi:unnamed protein product [Oikopleura dioica]|uniref:Uncharacterized protein n=1 Tax=Oikopleura dioica TaxID=34765 RepID=E4YF92_OIKDI|nr:unnamed protein product [Oikopleura dioica]